MSEGAKITFKQVCEMLLPESVCNMMEDAASTLPIARSFSADEIEFSRGFIAMPPLLPIFGNRHYGTKMSQPPKTDIGFHLNPFSSKGQFGTIKPSMEGVVKLLDTKTLDVAVVDTDPFVSEQAYVRLCQAFAVYLTEPTDQNRAMMREETRQALDVWSRNTEIVTSFDFRNLGNFDLGVDIGFKARPADGIPEPAWIEFSLEF